MITPTSALIVVPLIGRPQARLKTTSHAGEPAWLVVRIMTGLTGQRPRSIPQSCLFKAPAITFCQRDAQDAGVSSAGGFEERRIAGSFIDASYIKPAPALLPLSQSSAITAYQYLLNWRCDIEVALSIHISRTRTYQ
ncbi:hypothetical protein [Pseudomonas syringae]|uniref:hypothetical protein n=1 Tax=Pseudomonas syringae TaxID=317 RepID=UPI0012B0925B|nr:hypothetical protein [Pseudomonas syringae]